MSMVNRTFGGVIYKVFGDPDYAQEFYQEAKKLLFQLKNGNTSNLEMIYGHKQFLDGRVRIYAKSEYGRDEVKIYVPEDIYEMREEKWERPSKHRYSRTYHPYFCAYAKPEATNEYYEDDIWRIGGFFVCGTNLDLDDIKWSPEAFDVAADKSAWLARVRTGQARDFEQKIFDLRPNGYNHYWTADDIKYSIATDHIPGAFGVDNNDWAWRMDSHMSFLVGPTGQYETQTYAGIAGAPGAETVVGSQQLGDARYWTYHMQSSANPSWIYYGGYDTPFAPPYADGDSPGYRTFTGPSFLGGLYHNSWYDFDHYGMVYTKTQWSAGNEGPSGGNGVYKQFFNLAWNESVGDVIVNVNGTEYVLSSGVETAAPSWGYISGDVFPPITTDGVSPGSDNWKPGAYGLMIFAQDPSSYLGDYSYIDAIHDAEDERGKQPYYCDSVVGAEKDDAWARPIPPLEDTDLPPNGFGLPGGHSEAVDGEMGSTRVGNFKYFYISENRQIFLYSFLVRPAPAGLSPYGGAGFQGPIIRGDDVFSTSAKIVYGIVRAGDGWPEELRGNFTSEYSVSPSVLAQASIYGTGLDLPDETGPAYVSFEVGLAEIIQQLPEEKGEEHSWSH